LYSNNRLYSNIYIGNGPCAKGHKVFSNKEFARASGGKTLPDFNIAPFVTVVLGDDIASCRLPVKEMFALYIGGMGARGKNFYNDYAARLDYEEAASKIQNLYLADKNKEAVAAVPDQLVDDCALVGSADRIRDRLQVWKEANEKRHVGSLLASGASIDAIRLLAEEFL
jgi:alkanesulfonate monooxygenase SsuD/methylene tetrahydromethanopterin reductase-like flavin-dependent oxidoreductase (luciferase family)